MIMLEEHLVGSGVVVMVVTGLMKWLKSKWKPNIRELYIIPAFIFSAVLVGLVMFATSGFMVINWLLLSLLVVLASGFMENDLLSKSKKFVKSDTGQEIIGSLLNRGQEKQNNDD